MLGVKKLACVSVAVVGFTTLLNGIDDVPISALWSKFETTRQGLRNLHQEFEVEERIDTGNLDHLSRYRIVVDLSQSKWREQSVGGSEDITRIFDGHNLFLIDAGGGQYTQGKNQDKDEPLPGPYETKLDWGKAKELEHLPCGFSGKDHACVVIEAPVKAWVRLSAPGDVALMRSGTARVMIDTETGMWLRCQIVVTLESSSTSRRIELKYAIKRLGYSAAPDLTLFKLPDGLQEVKDFKPWDEGRIKKELAGKPAPDFHATDIQGKPVSLADLKGKTVLLDFWTTWCPPCQADAPSIEKLNEKYGAKDLQVIGISVSEDREIVEKYLKKHPHNFPVVLSSENLLPRPYQISVFPTYLIIAPDGTLVTAEQGDQGFGHLRKALEKSGMQTE